MGDSVLVRFSATSVGQLLKIKELTSLEACGSYYPLMQRHIHKEWSRHYNERSDTIKKTKDRRSDSWLAKRLFAFWSYCRCSPAGHWNRTFM